FYDPNGRRTFQTIRSGSDDHEEHRIYWVTPGRYYVNATYSPAIIAATHLNELVEPGYMITYYPGTIDPSTAATIDVQPGAELSTIDFSLRRQQLFHVRGRVFDARTGQPSRNVSIQVTTRSAVG